MRLFTALWPSDEAAAALAEVVGPAPDGWRATDPAGWHITLAFHGEADAAEHAAALDSRAAGLPAPRLRLAGAGAFPRHRWAAVEADPTAAFVELVAAAGGDNERIVAHLTLLIRRSPTARLDLAPPWQDHVGPWWTPPEVTLVASEPAGYRVVHRVPLVTAPA
ncbi:2'-5' RNA ligase family protein [Pseudonocardia sp. TRM90224]|uniref:2'-5' RNA ligase family protein n=1 Tax=Pseudonocardia sp. TRM90224 TaxID=2812678 RepID=UPI001E6372F3|nr:2'-5' RNA ligase family protein [Pseudonocardia sp. TRM90224]